MEQAQAPELPTLSLMLCGSGQPWAVMHTSGDEVWCFCLYPDALDLMTRAMEEDRQREASE